jgi:hypothetical protein
MSSLKWFSSAKSLSMSVRRVAGILNTIYLVRSVVECGQYPNSAPQNRVCDQQDSMQTCILVLSAITSGVMLGYKVRARHTCRAL